VKIGKAFEMNVVAYDLYPDMTFAQENNFLYKSLAEVVSESDIITLHAPYTKENHHLINKENITLMKKGVYLINTARGELVDTEALVAGLKEGIIVGAGLDVLEEERTIKENNKISILNHELMKMPNVIITPHIAFYSKEAVDSILQTTLENIKGFIFGNPINIIK
jgi:D-lactate dehydrogenase